MHAGRAELPGELPGVSTRGVAPPEYQREARTATPRESGCVWSVPGCQGSYSPGASSRPASPIAASELKRCAQARHVWRAPNAHEARARAAQTGQQGCSRQAKARKSSPCPKADLNLGSHVAHTELQSAFPKGPPTAATIRAAVREARQGTSAKRGLHVGRAESPVESPAVVRARGSRHRGTSAPSVNDQGCVPAGSDSVVVAPSAAASMPADAPSRLRCASAAPWQQHAPAPPPPPFGAPVFGAAGGRCAGAAAAPAATAAGAPTRRSAGGAAASASGGVVRRRWHRGRRITSVATPQESDGACRAAAAQRRMTPLASPIGTLIGGYMSNTVHVPYP